MKKGKLLEVLRIAIGQILTKKFIGWFTSKDKKEKYFFSYKKEKERKETKDSPDILCIL